MKMKRKIGFAPAAIVSSRSSSDASVLKTRDINRSLRSPSPLIAARKFSAEEDDAHSMAILRFRPDISKENNKPDADNNDDNPYLTIAMARDSLRQKEESKKKLVEINQLEDELNDLKQQNDTERLALQNLEEVLIKRRRRVEKCRRLAEAQSSYKSLLEKMIRDAMHQSVVYKEQLRLNKAATSVLMARLEAQRAICDASENELHQKFKQEGEIVMQIRPHWEQARKRSRIHDTIFEERHDKATQLLSRGRIRSHIKEEPRVCLEDEERKASEALLSSGEEGEESDVAAITDDTKKGEPHETLIAERNESSRNDKLEESSLREGNDGKNIKAKEKKPFSLIQQEEEDEKPTNMTEEKLKQLAIRERCCIKKERKKQSLFPQSSLKGEGKREYRKLGVAEDEVSQKGKFKQLAIRESCLKNSDVPMPKIPTTQNLCKEDDADNQNQVGKGNVEKWLQMLLENMQEEGLSLDSPTKEIDRPENSTNELIHELNSAIPQKATKFLRLKSLEENDGSDQNSDKQPNKDRNCRDSRNVEVVLMNGSNVIGAGSSSCVSSRKSSEAKVREEKKRGLPISENERAFHHRHS